MCHLFPVVCCGVVVWLWLAVLLLLLLLLFVVVGVVVLFCFFLLLVLEHTVVVVVNVAAAVIADELESFEMQIGKWRWELFLLTRMSFNSFRRTGASRETE
jgi:hypothetical protein